MNESQSLFKVFIEHGLAGAVAILALWWAYRKDREAKIERDRAEASYKQLTEKYQQQTEAVMERHVAKAESWMDKYYEIAGGLKSVVESLRQRFGKRERNGNG